MKLGTFDINNWYSGEHTKRDGNTPANVHIIPDSIPANLAFFDGSAVIAKTQLERNTYDLAQAELAETAKQAAKPDALKQAENDFINIILAIPQTLNIGISTVTKDIVHILESEADKEDGIISELQAVRIGLKLDSALSEVERQGGSWYGLPAQPHTIGE